jgi:hypothetical protein
MPRFIQSTRGWWVNLDRVDMLEPIEELVEGQRTVVRYRAHIGDIETYDEFTPDEVVRAFAQLDVERV